MEEREPCTAAPGGVEPQDLDDLIFRWESDGPPISQR